MEVKCATSFDERFDPNNVLNKYEPLYFYDEIIEILRSSGSALVSIPRSY